MRRLAVSDLDLMRAGPWLATLRLLVAVMALGLRFFFRRDGGGGVDWNDPSLLLLAGLIAFDAVLLASSRIWTRSPRAKTLLVGMCLVDFAAFTVLCYWTGGPQSSFLSLFFPSILIGSLLLSRRYAGLLAAVATIGLSLVAGLYLWSVRFTPPRPLPGVEQEYLLSAGESGWQVSRLLLAASMIFAVAYVGGWLGERERSVRRLTDEILANTAEGAAYFENGRLAFYNEPFRRLLGEAVRPGAAAVDLLPGQEGTRLAVLLGEVLAAPRRLELPETGMRPALELRLSGLARGRRAGMLMLAIDLTTQREAEQLTARFAASRELAAGMAHELRNPLTAVRGAVQELGEYFPPGSSQRRLVGILIRESDRLGRIIGDFQKFADTRPPRIVSARMADLAGDIEAMWRRHPDFGATALSIAIHPANLELRADRDQLVEVLFNFGANALSLMGGRGRLGLEVSESRPDAADEAGGGNFNDEAETVDAPPPGFQPMGGKSISGRVAGPSASGVRRGRVSTWLEPGVWIRVTDTGPGIPPDMLGTLFMPFVSRRPGGTGLGLAVARRAVEAHDGRIGAYNRSGGGACFWVWLPKSGPVERMGGGA